ncbi:LIC12192 family sporadic carbohydrate cluster protein [Synechococcus sp. MIT S9452]|uniref:LIC12192 family sporadic carbohydrate cluster protein n=1 Tax=Synechococcus sp. MIT S9452 TaxID=3082546 RepID=UPI0039A6F65D
MKNLARGYIASGEFNGNRIPQHLQNQIVKLYCDSIGLEFVLSRAEYWINGSTQCQLWAALNEGFNHIVFYSLWQLPNEHNKRFKVYQHCLKNNINLHFAVERIRTEVSEEAYTDLETLIQSNLLILEDCDYSKYLGLLETLL